MKNKTLIALIATVLFSACNTKKETTYAKIPNTSTAPIIINKVSIQHEGYRCSSNLLNDNTYLFFEKNESKENKSIAVSVISNDDTFVTKYLSVKGKMLFSLQQDSQDLNIYSSSTIIEVKTFEADNDKILTKNVVFTTLDLNNLNGTLFEITETTIKSGDNEKEEKELGIIDDCVDHNFKEILIKKHTI